MDKLTTVKTLVTKKVLTNYLHFYYVQQVVAVVGENILYFLTAEILMEWDDKRHSLALRPLGDMSDDEMDMLLRIGWPTISEMVPTFKFYRNEVQRHIKHGDGIGYAGFKENGDHFVSGTLSFCTLEPEQIVWLLKNNFDIFHLIESKLAIDATKLKTFQHG